MMSFQPVFSILCVKSPCFLFAFVFSCFYWPCLRSLFVLLEYFGFAYGRSSLYIFAACFRCQSIGSWSPRRCKLQWRTEYSDLVARRLSATCLVDSSHQQQQPVEEPGNPSTSSLSLSCLSFYSFPFPAPTSLPTFALLSEARKFQSVAHQRSHTKSNSQENLE